MQLVEKATEGINIEQKQFEHLMDLGLDVKANNASAHNTHTYPTTSL